MENEVIQPEKLRVTGQDIDKVNRILADTGVSLPISFSEKRESWQLPVTDEFLEGINAQRKRLRARNLQIHRQSLDWARHSARFGGGIFAQGEQFYADGCYQIGCLRKRWQRVTTYMRGPKKLSIFKDTPWIHYYLKKEPGEECKVSSMYTFNLVELYGRSDEYLKGNPIRTRSGLQILSLIFAIVCWLLTGIIVPLMLLVLLIPDIRGYAVYLFWCALWSGSIAAACTWISNKFKLWSKWRLSSRQVVWGIREKTNDFCLEKFISIIVSRTQRLYYADSMEDIGDFISCTVTGFLQEHANVVNVEPVNFWFTGYREDGRYMYMDVTQRVRLEKDLGDRIKRSKETIMLQLMKPIQGIMSEDLYSDWSVVRVETHEK